MRKNDFNSRNIFAFIHDLSAAFIAWYLSYILRFNLNMPVEHFAVFKLGALLVLLSQTTAFIALGIHRLTWRFVSILDLKKILLMQFVSLSILVTSLFMLGFIHDIPRSVFIFYPVLVNFLLLGSRITYRAITEHKRFNFYIKKGKPVIVIGKTNSILNLVRDLRHSNAWCVVGILDNNKEMHGREILGVKVYGNIDDLSKLASRLSVKHIIISIPSATKKEYRYIIDMATQIGIEAFIAPVVNNMITGHQMLQQIRRVDVEDLLGRERINLDESGMELLIKKASVLVTGAGGSIGSELCRQIIRFNPSCLICLDISEYAIYKLEQEFISKGLPIQIKYIVGDVRHAARLEKLFAQYKFKVVYHAAAYKHVPLMENQNVVEAINNNVIGTYTVAEACRKARVDRFVLVSTDKAVNPTNVMGATKRLAEMICQGMQEKIGTQFVIVRFGNVLGSSGSVIPKFREQIKAGGPITVTHPEITRYFMSIPEAAQLVMQAGLMGEGGKIFVLDMGNPIRIVDLARDMIRLSGFTEDEIKIEFSGLRPGEKLYEEVLADDEHTLPTPHAKLRVALAKTVDLEWVNGLMEWISTTLDKEEVTVKQELKNWLEEYQSDCNAL